MTSLLYVTDAETARSILEAGADVNVEDANGFSALHSAAYRCDKAIVGIFLEYHVCVDTKDMFGVTPLMIAAERGCDEVVRLLLDNGAIMDARDMYGVNAFKRACRLGNEKVMAIILEYMFNKGLLEENGRLAGDSVDDCSFVRYRVMGENIPVWIPVCRNAPDFSTVYSEMRSDDVSGSCLAEKFDGTRWYCAFINGIPVEKTRD